ncbi:MAG: nitronate monooxygenase family protein [Halopseudomonas yangmingensis]|uniref:Nitronate monooxygenase n=1 Tax=Halopseudomonas yangmingensis TaxID=1720063 RepID=A0A1I4U695_9GAMM|nr:nitronate monooxygenase family protein [Halopseudomonas yangmingensis]SFM84341.1 nitronate monooxygenase [Halopseudomonas yangmingensis]
MSDLVRELKARMELPVIASPLFIISNPRLVAEQCKNGIIGSFPALNARPAEVLEEWLAGLTEELAAFQAANPQRKVAPFAVNQIVHQSNDRLQHDLDMCAKYKVPLMITSLRAPHQAVEVARSYGGKVFHDVVSVRHAEKAIEAGVDGLILVCAGAGGHAGTLSPFALVNEVRSFWDGPIALSGSISRGNQILAAEAMGADFAYMGTRFIATPEANADEAYKQMLVDSSASDIVYSSLFTGVHGNYLRGSIEKSGLDPENLPEADKSSMSFGSGGSSKSKAWRDIWGAGQGVGGIREIKPTAEVIAELKEEYQQARQRLLGL